MNIVSWNCSQAFRKKVSQLSKMSPDLAVVPECESLEKMNGAHQQLFSYGLWFGDNPNKGLGVFSTFNYELTVHPAYNERFKWVVPIKVGGSEPFLLLAVWTKNHKDNKQSYIRQLFMALQEYKSILLEETFLVIGDWNSNAIWDRSPGVGNYSTVVKLLRDYGLESAYHIFNGESHGAETQPTYYFRYDRNKPYHIDYCFIPQSWTKCLHSVQVGSYDDWRPFSDHVPLNIQF